jgi:hypothetical protein
LTGDFVSIGAALGRPVVESQILTPSRPPDASSLASALKARLEIESMWPPTTLRNGFPSALKITISPDPQTSFAAVRTAHPETAIVPSELTATLVTTASAVSKGVAPGDLALVHRRQQSVEQIVVAVAADTGNANELGEASIALGNPAAGRLPGNIADGVTTLLFPGHRAEQPITAATLAAKRGALLEAVGGETAVRACGASESGNGRLISEHFEWYDGAYDRSSPIVTRRVRHLSSRRAHARVNEVATWPSFDLFPAFLQAP